VSDPPNINAVPRPLLALQTLSHSLPEPKQQNRVNNTADEEQNDADGDHFGLRLLILRLFPHNTQLNMEQTPSSSLSLFILGNTS
jgi:hypothetical protein